MTLDVRSSHWTRRKGIAPRPTQNVTKPFPEGTQPHPGRPMTEKEFLNWIEEKTRAEWVNGEVIIMSPVSNEHDEIQGWLLRLLAGFVEERSLGRISGPEFFVRLPKITGRRLPDIFFVATSRLHGFEKTAFVGPPELILEIVSPDSVSRDYREKFSNYQTAGVKEYWIVDPQARRIEAHELVRGNYRLIAEKNGAIHSKILKNFYLRPNWIWQRPLPTVSNILREIAAK